MQGKTGLKYREGGCTVGSGRVATEDKTSGVFAIPKYTRELARL